MPNLDFTLTGDYVELHNLLKITGLADSGGSAKVIVASGAVTGEGRNDLAEAVEALLLQPSWKADQDDEARSG